MLGEALAYPFVLLRRRPVTVLGIALLVLALSTLVDYCYYQFIGTRRSSDVATFALRFFSLYALRSIAHAPMATILVAALVDLKRRANPSALSDWMRTLAVSLVFLLLVVTPFETGALMLAQHLGNSGVWLAAILNYVAYALVVLPFVFAWAHTLAMEHFTFFRSVSLLRGRVWTVTINLTPVFILVGLASVASSLLYARLATALMEWDESLARSAYTLLYVAISESVSIAAGFIFDTTVVYLYARVVPQPPHIVAEHF